jgi:hypothetical protein
LIAGEYHGAYSFRDLKTRRLVREKTLDYYLTDMTRDGAPPPVATFSTREEAEAWLHHQPEPPRQVFLRIAGEDHLAVYHPEIDLRALYPVSRAGRG